MSATTTRDRLYHLDWLRVLAMGMVFLFHNARFFDWDYWHVKNAQTSVVAMVFVASLSFWLMPLFFVLAGAAVCLSLQRRTASEFLKERGLRLLVPYLFGLLVLIPPQVYVELASRGKFTDTFLAFYPTFFGRLGLSLTPRILGNAYHLWFLGFLFVYSALSLPVFSWLRGAGRGLVEALAGLGERRGGIFLFALPVAAVQMALRAGFPAYLDWADFFFWLLFFLYGYLIYADQRLSAAVRRDAPAALALGAVSLLGLFGLFAAGRIVPWESHPGYYLGYLGYQLLKSFHTWFWLVAFLGLGARHLEFSNRTLRYASEAVMPFYVLHQTIILLIGYYVVRWRLGILPKYLCISAASLVAIMALYELLIRRARALRLLFGLRPAVPPGRIPSAAQERLSR